MTIAAIDPGNKVGLAVAEDDGTLIELKTYDYYRRIIAVIDVLKWASDDDALIIFERPKKGSARKRSRSLGRCEEKALTLAAICRAYGAKVKFVEPCYDLTKLSPAQFRTYYPEWEGKTSEHARDAALVLWLELKRRGLR